MEAHRVQELKKFILEKIFIHTESSRIKISTLPRLSSFPLLLSQIYIYMTWENYWIVWEYTLSLSHWGGPMMGETHPYMRGNDYTLRIPNNNPMTVRGNQPSTILNLKSQTRNWNHFYGSNLGITDFQGEKKKSIFEMKFLKRFRCRFGLGIFVKTTKTLDICRPIWTQ